MAKSPSAYSARSVVSPPPPTDIIVWPCWSAAEAKPWPSCSLVSIKPSTRRSPKTFIPTKSIPRRAIPKLFILTVHIIPSWTLRLTQTRCQHGLLRTLTDEQTFRYNNRKDMDNADRFKLALSQIVGKRLTYAEVTGKVGETAF